MRAGLRKNGPTRSLPIDDRVGAGRGDPPDLLRATNTVCERGAWMRARPASPHDHSSHMPVPESPESVTRHAVRPSSRDRCRPSARRLVPAGDGLDRGSTHRKHRQARRQRCPSAVASGTLAGRTGPTTASGRTRRECHRAAGAARFASRSGVGDELVARGTVKARCRPGRVVVSLPNPAPATAALGMANCCPDRSRSGPPGSWS